MTSTTFLYRIFDLRLRSSDPLPGLPDGKPGAADLSVEFRAPDVSAETFDAFHAWTTQQGQVTAAVAREGATYRLRFPGWADCRIEPGAGALTVFPAPGRDAASVAHLVTDQAIPRLVGHGGRLVVHAATVLLDSGAVALLGDTGCGKSTLAGSFAQAGAQLLGDDCLLVERRGAGLVGIPAYPGLRLWPDSARTVAPTGYAEGRARGGKQVLRAPPGRVESACLSGLFVLAPPRPEVTTVTLETLTGMSAMQALIEAAFTLDVVERAAVERTFELAGAAARGGVPIWRLQYPRRYECLPEVRAAIAGALGS